jgi:3-hydroxybutyryl-CoA dehydratase
METLPVNEGSNAKFTKTVAESDIYGFAGLTGDFAAPHVDEEFMKASQYGKRVGE